MNVYRDTALAVTGGMGLFLALHVLLWRRNPSTRPRILLLWLLGAIGGAMSLFVFHRLRGLDLVFAAVLLWLDAFVLIFYSFFYAGISRSVSVTLLAKILQAGNRPVKFDTLVAGYIGSARFSDRLKLMEQLEMIAISADNHVSLKPKGRTLALVIKYLSAALGVTVEG